MKAIENVSKVGELKTRRKHLHELNQRNIQQKAKGKKRIGDILY